MQEVKDRYEALAQSIKELLEKINPNGYNYVNFRWYWDSPNISIQISPLKTEKDWECFGISFSVRDGMELKSQIFGGHGGCHFYRKPRLDDKNEHYLAMARVNVPFRKPKPEEKFILKSLERTYKRFLDLLEEYKGELFEKDLELLKSQNIIK